ncbi:MAG TPA: ribosome-associated translation inhibitor RaiA [Candidatus Paceibacterota bacterium]|nr:ribosome-associated translation inhibitor RaiA [Candidatus Paceibacterota bacterium]
MNITITAQTIHLSPELKSYIEKRMRGLTRFTSGNPVVTVEVGKMTMHHHHGDVFEAKVMLRTLLGQEYYATSQKADLYEAIDDVRDELMRLLTADKKKHDTLWRRGARKIKRIIKGFQ